MGLRSQLLGESTAPSQLGWWMLKSPGVGPVPLPESEGGGQRPPVPGGGTSAPKPGKTFLIFMLGRGRGTSGDRGGWDLPTTIT
jgi:hypothetical protein